LKAPEGPNDWILTWEDRLARGSVTEPPNYDGPHVHVMVIMISDSRTYIPHNLKGLLSSEQDPITGVLQYFNNLFKIPSE
jgi:hypothetical protein